jgi:nucleoside-diphosphate-sugar epimerase
MTLLIFGLGYTSSAFYRRVGTRFGAVIATNRSGGSKHGLTLLPFDSKAGPDPALADAIRSARIVLVSTPPGPSGDPVLASFREALATAPALAHILYLSTIGVYGDHAGAWIDGQAGLRTASERGIWRVAAEQQWLAFGLQKKTSVQIFRLGGIYGPGRNPLVDLAIGTARRIEKAGQVFNRIHVDDIARVLEAAIDKGSPGAIWNVVDNEPAPPQDVIAYAADLAGAPVPPLLKFEQAEMTPMARSFYADSRRVSNRALLRGLDLPLLYPSYREGIEALFDAGEYDPAVESLRPRDKKP